VKARLAAAAIALVLAFPATGRAGDNPWTAIKQLFHEPVSELKQQLKQLRSPARATTAPKPKASVADTDDPGAADAAAPVPIPVARPASDTIANGAAKSTAVFSSTPPQGNSPILIDRSSGFAKSGADVAVTGSVASAGVAETLPPPTSADQQPQLATTSAPIPRPRPDNAIAYAAVGPVPPAAKSAAAIGAVVGPLPSIARPPPAARSTCGVALARLGVEAKPIAPIHEGACGVPEPVAVAALGGGATDLTTKAIVGCRTAEVLASWLRDEAQPAARQFLGGDIVGLRVAASYTCRTRNGIAGAKLSEHARGSAIDISAFNVAGRGWIEVGGLHGLAATRFLRTIRKSACGPFTTVLGPGSDAHHSDHFHFDLAQRSKRGRSKGLYCR
jgi:hypothetical protein